MEGTSRYEEAERILKVVGKQTVKTYIDRIHITVSWWVSLWPTFEV